MKSERKLTDYIEIVKPMRSRIRCPRSKREGFLGLAEA